MVFRLLQKLLASWGKWVRHRADLKKEMLHMRSLGPIVAQRELVLVARREVNLRVINNIASALYDVDVSRLNELLSLSGAIMKPLFGLSEERLRRKTSEANEALAFSRFYRVYAPDDELDRLAEQAGHDPAIEAAYIKPVANLPIWFTDISANK